MKRRIALSIALTLSVLVSLASSDSSAHVQQGRRRVADSGIVSLGPNQVLRIIVNGLDGNDTISVRFAWTKYMQASCNADGVCRHVVQSQGSTAPVSVEANESASYDVQGFGGSVRVGIIVAGEGADKDLFIINKATGEVVSQIIMANTEGDFH